MRVFCERQESQPDTYCHFCGQGFALHWEEEATREQADVMADVDLTLRLHHLLAGSHGAHPSQGFVVRSLDETRARKERLFLAAQSCRAA